MYREIEDEVICRECGETIGIGFNFNQSQAFVHFTRQMKELKLCHKCLIEKKTKNPMILIDTIKNMNCIGII